MSAPVSGATRSPFVYWAQDAGSISLRVDIRNAKDIRVEAKKSEFSFSAQSDDGQHYTFKLPLHGQVLVKPLEVHPHENRVEISLRKAKKDHGFWPALLDGGAGAKPAWLKFDFAKWKDPDGEDGEDGDEKELREKNAYDELIRQFQGQADVLTPQQAVEKLKRLFNGYLCLYNVCIFVAHLYVLGLLLYGCATKQGAYLGRFWRERYASLVTVTLLQYMDVLHAWMEITKSGWKTAAIQITGRLTVLWIIDGNPSVHAWLPTLLLMGNYMLVEVIRYPYYALHSIKLHVRPITWLRYNVWMVLYPVGFILEATLFIASIPHYYASRNYSLVMPNAANFAFNFGVFLAGFTFTLFPFIAYTLLMHMNRQRKQRAVDSAKKRS